MTDKQQFLAALQKISGERLPPPYSHIELELFAGSDAQGPSPYWRMVNTLRPAQHTAFMRGSPPKEIELVARRMR